MELLSLYGFFLLLEQALGLRDALAPTQATRLTRAKGDPARTPAPIAAHIRAKLGLSRVKLRNGAIRYWPSTVYARSKPAASNRLPRTSPTPARSVTGFSPIGSATKFLCFCDVLDMVAAAGGGGSALARSYGQY
uniref:Uncharacterized protein n=1 Tax=Anopheles merus TaxID=30066 RepID=A0A182VI34_ANOME